ncbi:hypothetical protein C0Q70_05265 [Pomacea canaliculata]|uniref:Uncharacterized protein n=1 Tax=Pomacea canaliculata TaxID=400727 RepID=A0A2T7PKQ1_POMCA|nr:hypothetical protein C0Q70_05265 [Pomacea canaliculata]
MSTNMSQSYAVQRAEFLVDKKHFERIWSLKPRLCELIDIHPKRAESRMATEEETGCNLGNRRHLTVNCDLLTAGKANVPEVPVTNGSACWTWSLGSRCRHQAKSGKPLTGRTVGDPLGFRRLLRGKCRICSPWVRCVPAPSASSAACPPLLPSPPNSKPLPPPNQTASWPRCQTLVPHNGDYVPLHPELLERG